MTSQTFNLDLIPQGVPPIVHVSQYDKGQTWEIHLYENGIVFPVPANTSAAIQGTKPDSTGFQFPAVITAGDNVVTFTLEQQMTVFSGDIDCELVLVNGDDQVATINFILSVEPTTLDDDTVISKTQLPLIEQAAELGAVINNYATQIHADAETASAAADAATSATESTAADSATATQAADDAQASQTEAATSASNAATSETNAAASATAAAGSASSAAQEATNAAASAAEAARLAATDMTGATASTAGTHGLVPAPNAGDENKFLTGGGAWVNVTIPPQSYVGMVIHSTTLDTEAKVIAQYGGTAWIQHSGYFLRGAASGVIANSATTTGGSDDAVVVKHTHTQNPHSHTPSNGTNFGVYGASGTSQFFFQGGTSNNGNFTGATSTVTPAINETGADGTGKNIPAYKSVYIWERTV